MIRIFTFILPFLLLLSFAPETRANHVMGADIEWICLGNDSFLVTLNFYRDCNGINLSAATLNFAPVGCAGTGFSVIATLSSPAIDITNVCYSSCNRCDASTCAFPYGFQKLVFTAIVYLGNQTCCDWRVSFQHCCMTLPSSPPFYTEAVFDKCIAPCNNSPVFIENPVILLSTQQCFVYNHGATDIDGDSLIYLLTPPLQGPGNPITYTSPYSYDKPFFFNGFPNSNLLPGSQCRGFHLNRFSGELIFQPMQQQFSILAVKAVEYRNGVKISETTRTLQMLVADAPPNNVPYLSGINNTTNNSITLCPGSNACFTITAHDPDVTDSIYLNFYGDLPGASFSYVYDSINHITATICWNPQQQDVRNNPYTFSLKVYDNACPLPAHASRPYQVFVKEADSINYSATPSGCGMVEFTASSISQNTIFTWDIDNFIFTGNSQNYTFQAPGIHHYKLYTLTSGCSQEFNDSLSLPPFQTFSLSLGNDTTVCEGSTLSLIPQLPGSLNDYTYVWNNDTTTTAQRTISIDAHTQIILTATNISSCTATDTLTISVFPKTQVQFTPIPDKCENAQAFSLSPFVLPGGGTWSGNGVNSNYFYPSLLSPGTYWLTYEFTNSNGCKGIDSIAVTVQQKFSVSAGNNILTCEKAASVNLSPSLPGGLWSGSAATAVSNNRFNPAISGTGIFELIYTISDNTCSASDTISIEVLAAPSIQFSAIPDKCENAQDFSLGPYALPVGGIWSGNGVSNNSLHPGLLSAGTHWLHYEYTDANSCSNTDSIAINIQAVPTLSAGNDIIVCENAPNVNLTPSPPGGIWSGQGASSVFNNQFNPSLSGPGVFELVYLINDNICTASDTLLVEVHAAPRVNTDSDTTICQGDTISVSASGGTNYSWAPVSGLSNPNSANTYAFPTSTTIYTVTVTNNNGCQNTGQVIITVDTCITNINTQGWEMKIFLFPNPANESITLLSEEVRISKVKITDALGKEVSVHFEINGNSRIYSVKEYPAGLYFMSIETDTGITVRKFMKD